MQEGVRNSCATAMRPTAAPGTYHPSLRVS